MLQRGYNTIVNKAIDRLGLSLTPQTAAVAAELERLIADEIEIEATALERMEALRGSIRVLGLTLAKATGRDSGAYIPPGVTLLSGSVGSGGSRANWRTVVDSGSTFRFRVPRFVFDKYAKRYSIWSLKIAQDLQIDDVISDLDDNE